VAAAARLARLDGVADATAREGGVELIVDQARGRLPELLQAASDAGLGVTAVEVVEPDLEAVFLHLTGRALRD
jgi:ABC-2 type transport system ATP-binding protein